MKLGYYDQGEGLSAEVILSPADTEALRDTDVTMQDVGLSARVLLEIDSSSDGMPTAKVNGWGSLHIILPPATEFPVVVANNNIAPMQDSDSAIVVQIFGTLGTIGIHEA